MADGCFKYFLPPMCVFAEKFRIFRPIFSARTAFFIFKDCQQDVNRWAPLAVVFFLASSETKPNFVFACFISFPDFLFF